MKRSAQGRAEDDGISLPAVIFDFDARPAEGKRERCRRAFHPAFTASSLDRQSSPEVHGQPKAATCCRQRLS